MGFHLKCSPLAAGLLLLYPAAACANGVSPILNLFHAHTWQPALLATLVIVAIETLLLRWWCRPITFRRAAGLAIVINTASSAAGSLVLLAFQRDTFFLWDSTRWLAPLFVITLATEIPLLHAGFKTRSIRWLKAAVWGLGLNAVSYVAVIVLEIAMLAFFTVRGHRLDRQQLAAWHQPRLLDRFSGRLYATASETNRHGLRFFNPVDQSWTPVPHCPAIEPNKWDIEGNLCAYVHWDTGSWETRGLAIARLPDFSTIVEITPDDFKEPPFDSPGDWKGFLSLALSPDTRRLAFLFRNAEVVAPRNRSSHYVLGERCRLIVVDTATGLECARAGRWASAGSLCWLADSQTVLFSSFDKESVYETPKSAVKGNFGHGVAHAKSGPFASGLYAFHIDTGTITRFGDGRTPSLAAATGQVLVWQDEQHLVWLDSSGREQARLECPRLWFTGPVVSPDGQLTLVPLMLRSPFHHFSPPVLMESSRPDVRHVLPLDGFSYRYDWTRAE